MFIFNNILKEYPQIVNSIVILNYKFDNVSFYQLNLINKKYQIDGRCNNNNNGKDFKKVKKSLSFSKTITIDIIPYISSSSQPISPEPRQSTMFLSTVSSPGVVVFEEHGLVDMN